MINSFKNQSRSLLKDGLVRAVTGAGLDEVSRQLWMKGPRARNSTPIHIVNYHDVPHSMSDAFRAQLEWVRESFDIIDFELLKKRLTSPPHVNPLKPRKAGVLLTFDDGLRSHLDVAAPMLEELGLRGVFFVIPGFCSKEKYLFEGEIGELHARGHTVGCHTMNHVSLEKVRDDQLVDEILGSGDWISQCTGSLVESFAWPFSWNRIRLKAWELIQSRYPYCFSPCPGIVYPGITKPSLLWRTNVEGDYTESSYRFMFSPIPEMVWTWRRQVLRNILLG